MNISIIIPSKNEASSIRGVVDEVLALGIEAEVIVVDDGSTDDTHSVLAATGATVIRHPYSKGNGAAVKSGAVAARGDVLIFLDGDGQHDPAEIPRLLSTFEDGYDLIVGARTGHSSHANLGRWLANTVYNRFSSWMVGHVVEDLTSGMRVVNREKFLSILYLLPNGFSYPTTSTMAFYRLGHSVGFKTISVRQREGQSHLRPLRDGLKFLLIIFKIGTLYSPLKIYVPFAFVAGFLGMANYVVASLAASSWRFTNMSALLVSTGLIIFLLGLLSEQITNLQYRPAGPTP